MRFAFEFVKAMAVLIFGQIFSQAEPEIRSAKGTSSAHSPA